MVEVYAGCVCDSGWVGRVMFCFGVNPVMK